MQRGENGVQRRSMPALERRILRCLSTAVLSVLLYPLFSFPFHESWYALPFLPITGVFFSFRERSGILRGILGMLACIPFILLDALTGRTFPIGFAIAVCLSSAGIAWMLGKVYGQQAGRARDLGRELAQVQSVSNLSGSLLTASAPHQLYTLTLQSLYSVTDCPCVLFTPQGETFRREASIPEGLMLYPADNLLHYCANRSRRCGRGTDYSNSSPLSVFPVKGEHSLLAVAAILTGTDRVLEEPVLSTVEHLLLRTGIAMERLTYLDREHAILMDKELEHMRSDFLRSISHDLRTPLTGIIGACSTLEQEGVTIGESDRRELVHGVHEEATWLLRIVENLLSVTRVGSSGPKLNRSEEPVEELLAEVLDKTRSRFPAVDLRISQPDRLVLVPVDPTLIVQVLMNLVDNAVKYAGSSPIELSAVEEEEEIRFILRDHGPGLSEEALANLFEPYGHHPGDYGHGMGLGLSICRSIITAHGGTIEGENAPDGGAVFTVTLPKETL